MTELVYMPYEYTEADGSKKVYEYLITKETLAKIANYGNVTLISVLPDADGEHLVFSWESESGQTGGRIEVYQEYIEDDSIERNTYAISWGETILYAVCLGTISSFVSSVAYWYFGG